VDERHVLRDPQNQGYERSEKRKPERKMNDKQVPTTRSHLRYFAK